MTNGTTPAPGGATTDELILRELRACQEEMVRITERVEALEEAAR